MKRHILILAALAMACSTTHTKQADSTPDEPNSGGLELTRTPQDDDPPEADDGKTQPLRVDVSGEPADWFVPVSPDSGATLASERVFGAACAMHVFTRSGMKAFVYCLRDDQPHHVSAVAGTRQLRFGKLLIVDEQGRIVASDDAGERGEEFVPERILLEDGSWRIVDAAKN